MVSFVDEYERQLDERGRIILPSKLREDICNTVYITQSTSEECLHLSVLQIPICFVPPFQQTFIPLK